MESKRIFSPNVISANEKDTSEIRLEFPRPIQDIHMHYLLISHKWGGIIGFCSVPVFYGEQVHSIYTGYDGKWEIFRKDIVSQKADVVLCGGPYNNKYY